MTGQMVSFAANGRTTQGYLALPPGGRGPGVVVIQEWWGLVDHIKVLADRFAAEGFVALAPDLYHGETTRSPDAAGKMLMALNIAEAGKELRGAAEYLLGRAEVEPKRVGVVGFCMGGQLALFAAAEHPDRITAAVDFYGIHPNAKVDPARVRVPVLAHFGTRDTTVPLDAAKRLVGDLERAGAPIEAHFYEADHAFVNDTRPEVHNPEAAALAWRRTLDFFRRHLSRAG
jgi:carboxymethylenebutenolidase